MDKKAAYGHLAKIRVAFLDDKIDASQYDSAIWCFLDILAREIEQERAAPRPADLAGSIESLRAEVAEVRAMLEAMANPPAYRVDTAIAMPPA